MKVRARLLLVGAVLPTAGTLAAVLAAGQVFRFGLERSLDESLRSQAAVERVSLFDGPEGEPHLPVPPGEGDAGLASAGGTVAVYGDSDGPVIRFPARSRLPARLDARPVGGPLLRDSTDVDGRPLREILVEVASAAGRRYVLRIARPVAELRATVRSFHQATLGAWAAMGLLLFAIQAWQAARLARRIRALTSRLPRLREGEFDVPDDRVGDEIAELRATLAEVAGRLRLAREAQERLIANAAHELRTPLGLMRTQIDLALRRDRDRDELRAALAEARREVDRLAVLAQQLLDLAAVEKIGVERSAGDLAAIARDAAEACRAAAAAEGIALRVDLPERAPALVEAGRIRQAVDNLLSNALKFSPRDGGIEVALERHGEVWRLRVADMGEGVDPSDREKIFEPFYRPARSRAPGAGLGLAIVRDVARQHGGRAFVEGAGRGSTFVLEIPAADRVPLATPQSGDTV